MKSTARLLIVSSICCAAASAATIPPGMGILLTERGELAAAATVSSSGGVEAVSGGDGILALPAPHARESEHVGVAPAIQPSALPPPAAYQQPLDIPPPPRVVSMVYEAPAASKKTEAPTPAQTLGLKRANALRSDSSGVIVLAPNTSASAVDDARATRNPWGVRVAARESMVEYKLSLDGVVFGKRGGTALINGVPVRVGERMIGPFVLAEIDPRGEVVMEYDGTFFRLSEGRVTEVRIPKF